MSKETKKGKNKPETNAKQNSDEGQANKVKEGDHFFVFCDEGSDWLWYLGVEQVLASGEMRVNHSKRANQQDYRNWYMPEEKDVGTVSEDQVLAKKT